LCGDEAGEESGYGERELEVHLVECLVRERCDGWLSGCVRRRWARRATANATFIRRRSALRWGSRSLDVMRRLEYRLRFGSPYPPVPGDVDRSICRPTMVQQTFFPAACSRSPCCILPISRTHDHISNIRQRVSLM
jgi:hypothetical protein